MPMVEPQCTPGLSVVIASVVGPPFLDACLASVHAEAAQLGAEVIVVSCRPGHAAELAERFPSVRVVEVGQRESVPVLRRIGVQHARGAIIAVIEEHCVAGSDWMRAALHAHAAGDYGVVGGPIVDDDYRRVRDWTVYFLEYNGSLPPAPGGPVASLNGANIAYRRDLLLQHLEVLDRGYWEAALHPVLLASGVLFLSVPDMLVRHRGPFDFGYYLRQRYWFSRAYAGARAQAMSPSRRLVYAVTAPLLPAVLLARMASRVWRKNCNRARFLQSVPLMIPAVAAYAAGEWIGYVAGPGTALLRVE